MNYKNEYINCNVCGKDNTEEISKKGHFNLPANLVLCKECGLAYLNPRWDKEAYSNFYKNEYDKYYRPTIINDEKSIFLSKVNPIIERAAQLNVFENAPKEILDIGSGEGTNLLAFKNIFPKSILYAIEPSTSAQKILKLNNISLISDDIDKPWNEEYKNCFDLIIMRHVLEHFLDPDAVLKKVHSILKKDGVLYLAVPNNLNTNRNKGWLRVPHTYYFNKYSLGNILTKNSFESIILAEGDAYNHHEIFVFSKKGNGMNKVEISRDHYALQKNAFDIVLKKEKNVIHRIKRLIKKIIKRYAL